MTQKTGLLLLLGLMWSVRLSAIKAAGLAGIPIYVVISVAALGGAVFFSFRALLTRDWPPIAREVLAFYGLSGVLGFLVPVALETAVAPRLPVFLFVVIIATVPLFTLILSILAGAERLRAVPTFAVVLGFDGAIAIVLDTAAAGQHGQSGPLWVAVAFGVPLFYALNTVYVATRWPPQAGAMHVAHAQVLIVAAAALFGSLVAGVIGDLRLAALDLPAMGLIVACETTGLLIYLRIARDHGATYVSFANYVSMVFAAILGAVWFGDKLTMITMAACIAIIASVAIYQRSAREQVEDQSADPAGDISQR